MQRLPLEERLPGWPVDPDTDPLLRKSFDLLRTKWGTVPYKQHERIRTVDLLRLPDKELVELWEQSHQAAAHGAAFANRGWYQALYRDIFRGRKVMDVGCGMGLDTIHYAEHGAEITFVDIEPSNVEVVRRICDARNLRRNHFLYMEDLSSLRVLPADYDFIYCCGSMINAPMEVSRLESQALLEHLPVGGRWVELGYPRARWEREGSLPFHQWGDRTDGGAPWMEWHDLEKLDWMMAPAAFDVILNLEFHYSEFVWFDLLRKS
ncbi:MAG: class I SAM-dependent methyltransferase [Acidobacteriia bacterium]|nr:class I SAM-dependent methyltransferase [Terriglobia bacterium]